MRVSRGLLLLAFSTPAAFHVACSASNGDPIPPEVHDASALDVGTSMPARDGATTTDEDAGTPVEDARAIDAPADVAPDAPTSRAVRISEVYVERGGLGSQAEYVELRGPVGAPVDDLFVRVVASNGAAQAFDVGLSGAKIDATGTWVIGGALASCNVDRLVTTPQGWGLDTKGAVQLLRGGSNEVIDVVGWTTDPDGGTVPQPAAPPKSTGEGLPFILPPSGALAFGRMVSGADTNDNRADFCSMAKTCGTTAAVCE